MISQYRLPPSIQNLIDELSKLPGIGPKTAARLTFHLLRAPEIRSNQLASALTDIKLKTRFCRICFNITEEDPCPLCSANGRDHGSICVVSDPLDIVALERTGDFKGLYHVLHGEISPINGVGPEHLKIEALHARVQATPPHEVILATNPTMEGETTALYLAKLLQPCGARITRIARGLPVGGDLEYADEVTLSSALSNRRDFS